MHKVAHKKASDEAENKTRNTDRQRESFSSFASMFFGNPPVGRRTVPFRCNRRIECNKEQSGRWYNSGIKQRWYNVFTPGTTHRYCRCTLKKLHVDCLLCAAHETFTELNREHSALHGRHLPPFSPIALLKQTESGVKVSETRTVERERRRKRKRYSTRRGHSPA